MATIVAGASGNWSNPATWIGGVKPGAGDIAQTGNFVVTIDENVTVAQLTPTGSGRFEVSVGGIGINADIVMSSTNTGGGLRCWHASGTVVLNGNSTGGAGTDRVGVVLGNAGNLTINGNVTGGTGGNAHGAVISGLGVLTINGTAYGHIGYPSYGALNNGAGTLNVTAAVGGALNSGYGVYNNSVGTVNVGTATGGSGPIAHGAYNNAGGTLICDLAVGNGFGPGGTTVNLTNGVYGNGTAGQTTRVRRIKSGPYGAAAIGGAVLLESHSTNSAEFRTGYNGATKTLVDGGAAADFPATGNVRAGTVYDVGSRVGTLAVPVANQVAAGIAVDATVGTAALTAAAVNAMFETAFGTTARPEPSSVPTANASVSEKISWLYARLRNKMVETESGASLRNDADSAAIGTVTMDDADGVFTQGKWS